MKEQRLLTESLGLEDYLAQAHRLRSQEIARLSGSFFRLPRAYIKRVFSVLAAGVESGTGAASATVTRTPAS